jgi:hypothetical protein
MESEMKPKDATIVDPFYPSGAGIAVSSMEPVSKAAKVIYRGWCKLGEQYHVVFVEDGCDSFTGIMCASEEEALQRAAAWVEGEKLIALVGP